MKNNNPSKQSNSLTPIEKALRENLRKRKQQQNLKNNKDNIVENNVKGDY